MYSGRQRRSSASMVMYNFDSNSGSIYWVTSASRILCAMMSSGSRLNPNNANNFNLNFKIHGKHPLQYLGKKSLINLRLPTKFTTAASQQSLAFPLCTYFFPLARMKQKNKLHGEAKYKLKVKKGWPTNGEIINKATSVLQLSYRPTFAMLWSFPALWIWLTNMFIQLASLQFYLAVHIQNKSLVLWSFPAI